MRNFDALLLLLHLISVRNTSCKSDHYDDPSGINQIIGCNRSRARSKSSFTDTPNRSRSLQTRNLETRTLGEIAYATYSKVLPCLNSSWMMDSWIYKNFTFPLDVEQHFRSLRAKTETFRKTKIHRYANYGGTEHFLVDSKVSAITCDKLPFLYLTISGPWIENIFIANYLKKPLSFFGGFIPLFVQWVDTDIVSKEEYTAINVFLKKELRPDVIYLAISQVSLFSSVLAVISVGFQ